MQNEIEKFRKNPYPLPNSYVFVGRLAIAESVMMVTVLSIQGSKESGLYLIKIFSPQNGVCVADKTLGE
jgi:hypothetical protein